MMRENSSNIQNSDISHNEDIRDEDIKDQLDYPSRLSILETKYKVVESHTIIVSKLSAKVSLLLTIMSFAVVIVSGAAVYTFTGLDKFKTIYNTDRLGIHNLINQTQIENRKLIQESINTLEDSIDDRIDYLENSMEYRMDSIEKQYIELKSNIKDK